MCVCVRARARARGGDKPFVLPPSAPGLAAYAGDQGPLTGRGQAPCGTAPSISVPCVQSNAIMATR